MGKNSKKKPRKRRRPELSIRTSGFRLELDRLPRCPTWLGWVLGVLAVSAIVAAKVFFHV